MLLWYGIPAVAVAPLRGVASLVMSALEGRVTELAAHLHALPGAYGLGSLPAKVAYGRCGKRDAAVDHDALDIGVDTLHLSSLDGEDGIAVFLSKGASC